jgi:hypothetical protein
LDGNCWVKARYLDIPEEDLPDLISDDLGSAKEGKKIGRDRKEDSEGRWKGK